MKINLRLNPIVKKELQVTARNMRLSWGVFAYEAVLAMAFLLAVLAIQEQSRYAYGGENFYSSFIYLFPILAVTQVCIVALIMPVITASSISGEKERQTFDIMLTTCMSPLAIVVGKVLAATMRILLFVAASLPVMALAFVVGGLSWSTLFYFLLTIVMLSFFSGSVGIFCSAFCRKSISAVILSFVIYFVIFVLTFLPPVLLSDLFGMRQIEMGESMLFMLFNPVVFFEEFFMTVMTGESLMGEVANLSRSTEVGVLTWHLAQGRLWMFASCACILAMSLGFMLLAAWKVNPLHSSSGKRRHKKHKSQ